MQTAQTIFMERYEWMLRWALKMTSGDHGDAEDLLHDTYLQFLRMNGKLHEIQNVEAYLHRMLRNLHLSRMTRKSRFQIVEIDAFEYDTLELSFEAVDPFRLAQVQQELELVCEWACRRRWESRSGSVLLLRFFLNYLPSEIGQICQCNRQGVEKPLQIARRDVRLLLRGMESPSSSDKGRSRKSFLLNSGTDAPALPTKRTNSIQHPVSFASSLREVILTPAGNCISPSEVRDMYRSQTTIERSTLAHLTSCACCLDSVNLHLGLPLLAARQHEAERFSGDDGDSQV